MNCIAALPGMVPDGKLTESRRGTRDAKHDRIHWPKSFASRVPCLASRKSHMHWLTQLFILALVASTLAQWWLSVRQTRNVSAHRETVPEPFAERVGGEEHRKAADYTLAKESLGRVQIAIDV